VPGTAGASDQFGAALAAGDLDRDGFAELAVGVPSETLGSIPAAGAVNVLYGAAGVLTGSGGQFFTQDSPRVPGVAEEVDIFGSELVWQRSRAAAARGVWCEQLTSPTFGTSAAEWCWESRRHAGNPMAAVELMTTGC
jgi:hypothetical protein